MLNYRTILEFIISIECMIISSMIPIYIAIPTNKNLLSLIALPVNWQIPIILYLSIVFSEKIVTRSFLIYIILGLFVLPIFYDGGSLGYLLTPNFGYLLGIFPLIKIINKVNKYKKVSIFKLLKIGLIALLSMHLVGIIYNIFQLMLFGKIELLSYYVAKFSLSKLPFHIFMLIPIYFLKRYKLSYKD